MRSEIVFGSLLAAIASASLWSCASGGGSAMPASGGGTSPVTSQAPAQSSLPAILIDGGASPNAYTGTNVASTESETTDNAGSDSLFDGVAATGSASPPPYAVPANPVGTHLLAFRGNGLSQQIFQFGSATSVTPVALAVAPGVAQTSPTVYTAIVFFASATLAQSTAAASYDVEITGGSGPSLFDVRIECTPSDLQAPSATGASIGATSFVREICALPSYGAVSGTYATKLSATTFAASSTYVGPTIANGVYPGATGVFTPGSTALPGTVTVGTTSTPAPTFGNAATLYLVVDERNALGGAIPSGATGSTFEVDYVYAEGLAF